MSRPYAITPSTLGLELHGRLEKHAWYLIESDEPDSTVEDVCDVLAVSDVEAYRLSAPDPHSLLAAPREDVACVPTGTWEWDEEAYPLLDRLREAVREAWPLLIWVASAQAVRRMVLLAPNTASFFQSSAGRWSEDGMSEAEVEAHLESLRARYGRSDEEVIAMATRGELPADADHDLWLVLLGRGELITTATDDEP